MNALAFNEPEIVNLITRAVIEAQIENLIGLLDAIDSDPDLEDDDPGGGNSEDQGELLNEDGVDDFIRAKPIYGIDQTKPLNHATALQRHDLQVQLADHERCRDVKMIALIRKRLASVDAREAEICAREGIRPTGTQEC